MIRESIAAAGIAINGASASARWWDAPHAANSIRPGADPAVTMEEVRRAADHGAINIERVVNEGHRLCYVLTRKRRV